jgi:hypothetical protein
VLVRGTQHARRQQRHRLLIPTLRANANLYPARQPAVRVAPRANSDLSKRNPVAYCGVRDLSEIRARKMQASGLSGSCEVYSRSRFPSVRQLGDRSAHRSVAGLG